MHNVFILSNLFGSSDDAYIIVAPESKCLKHYKFVVSVKQIHILVFWLHKIVFSCIVKDNDFVFQKRIQSLST